MIKADNASTSIYQVLKMSRAAMTHLLIIRMSSIWPRMAEDILTARPGTYQQDVLQTFCHCERGMIEAAKAYTADYEVNRMSRAAMTHLLILKRSYKEGRGHPYYTSGDVPTGRPGEFF